ncbi:hypothetical protein ACRYJU_04415 [Alloalcanivorax xenomutans]|uniref:hypothetical protein n=1 Tax=Alloalcanivorax xenomutans TaxID=1094342 RepID=UPI003D9BF87B
MRNEQILEKFGQILISEVRDEAIEKFEMVASGRIKSELAQKIHQKLSVFSDDEKKTIRDVVVSSIDDVIHNILWMIEQREEDVSLLCGGKGVKKEDVNKLSDGLSGEIYSEDGWIAKFSRYKENY